MKAGGSVSGVVGDLQERDHQFDRGRIGEGVPAFFARLNAQLLELKDHSGDDIILAAENADSSPRRLGHQVGDLLGDEFAERVSRRIARLRRQRRGLKRDVAGEVGLSGRVWNKAATELVNGVLVSLQVWVLREPREDLVDHIDDDL